MMNQKKRHRLLFWGIAFFSGTAGLIYEVLWFREFALYLGNTAEAAAWVLAILFCGLALGNALGGWWSKGTSSPLRAYAWVELFMSITGFGFVFFKNKTVDLGPLPLFISLTGVALLMGATLPLLLQSFPDKAEKLGREAPLLYGLNTLGGMLGVVLAGFFLPLWLGVSGGFLCAVLINLGLALITGAFSFLKKGMFHPQIKIRVVKKSEAVPRPLLLIAGLSGMGTLALQVLWTRMFSLVFQNSVYGFSFILFVILFALGLAALGSARLLKQGQAPLILLRRCLIGVALAIPIGGFIFIKSSGLESLFLETDPASYVLKVVVLTGVLLLLPMIAGGMILPLCWRMAVGKDQTAGWALGRLMSFNLIGGVLGSLGAGFLLLPQLGLWPALGVIAFCYALAAAYLSQAFLKTTPVFFKADHGLGAMPWTGMALALPLLLLFPLFSTQHLKAGESLLYLHQGAEAQVAVIQTRHGGRVMKVNNTYSLGSTKAARVERRMGQIPLLLHPHPKSVAFVGLATGITASAIFDHPVEDVTLIELLPEVLKAAPWFETENRGLLKDPRTEVLIADGRIAIPKGDAVFDVIISDLFVPWHAGATALYSLEYYKQAAERLAEDGFYAQWLPLYQMSEQEFKIIGKTFQTVFPHVTLWRANFSASHPIVALIGSQRPLSLAPDVLSKHLLRLKDEPGGDPDLKSVDDLMLFFAGDGIALKFFFEDAVLNTDNRPYIEYLAPISRIQRRRLTGELLAGHFLQFAESLETWRDHALAGAYLFQAKVAADHHNFAARIAALKAAVTLAPASARLARIERALKISGM